VPMPVVSRSQPRQCQTRQIKKETEADGLISLLATTSTTSTTIAPLSSLALY